MVAKEQTGKINAESFDDVPVLKRNWQAALRAGERLPRYEDVMLASLGRLADHMNGAVTSPGGSGSARHHKGKRATDRVVELERVAGADMTELHDLIAIVAAIGSTGDGGVCRLLAYDAGNSFRVA